MAQDVEKIAVSGSKGLIVAILALLLGAGGSAAVASATSAKPEPTPHVTQADVQVALSQADIRAREAAEKASAETLANCRRELSETNSKLTESLARINGKLDSLDAGLKGLEIAVARSRR